MVATPNFEGFVFETIKTNKIFTYLSATQAIEINT